ncbi:MAG: hypothetical protein DLM55_01830 [Acidimicrobiales bacterium]|nr:MAG: hypothetical protein DLM55_01830 [Acidimicrobiales bacterium]
MPVKETDVQQEVTGWRRVPLARGLTWATRLVGLLAVLSVLVPSARRRFRPELAQWFELPHTTRLIGLVLTAVAGVGLMMLATSLRRRKRRAWQVGVVLTSLLVVTHIMQRHGTFVGLVAAALLGGFIATRKEFTALPDPVGKLAAVVVFVELLTAGFALNWLLLAVRPHMLTSASTAWQRTQHAALALVGVEGPLDFRSHWLDDFSAGLGLTFGIAALLAGGYFLLRSAEPKATLSEHDEVRLRELITSQGHTDSLAYFALRRDKSVVFSPTGKAAVVYRMLAGVALASGDPLGDVEAWPGACSAFLEQCRRYGGVPAALGCSEQGARVWARYGLDALELGDEAVVDVSAFSLEGRAMRGVRQAVSRMRRSGYQVHVQRLADVTKEKATELATLAESWLGKSAERGYSMALSRFGDPSSDAQCVVVTAELDGQVRGLLQFVPWGEDGLSLDLMRRDPHVPDNGLNELMISDLLAACSGLGVQKVSLNFAILRASLERGERIGAGPVSRLWGRLLRLASRWWQIETLYRFNAKFSPSWIPRYLVFGTVRDLPRVAIAAFEAEGFGGRPPILLRLLRR